MTNWIPTKIELLEAHSHFDRYASWRGVLTHKGPECDQHLKELEEDGMLIPWNHPFGVWMTCNAWQLTKLGAAAVDMIRGKTTAPYRMPDWFLEELTK